MVGSDVVGVIVGVEVGGRVGVELGGRVVSVAVAVGVTNEKGMPLQAANKKMQIKIMTLSFRSIFLPSKKKRGRWILP